MSAKNGKASIRRVIQKYLGADFDQTRECNDAAAFLKYGRKTIREIKSNVNQNFVKSKFGNYELCS